jgi:hypothetical protein
MTKSERTQQQPEEGRLARARTLAGVDATDPDIAPPPRAVMVVRSGERQYQPRGSPLSFMPRCREERKESARKISREGLKNKHKDSET